MLRQKFLSFRKTEWFRNILKRRIETRETASGTKRLREGFTTIFTFSYQSYFQATILIIWKNKIV